jgi:hypothetical protein
MDKTMKNEFGEYAVRAGPALGTTGMTMFGYPIADIVQFLVAAYTILQIGFFLYGKLKKVRGNGR